MTAGDGGQVFSGKRALKRTDTGLAQDYYEGGAAPLTIPPSGKIFAYVYLDPKDPPKAIMLQFHTGDWKHRAVWGDYDAIDFGEPQDHRAGQHGHAARSRRMGAAGSPGRKGRPQARRRRSPASPARSSAARCTGTRSASSAATTRPAIRRSRCSAWRKARAGKDTPDVPPEIDKLLKDGPEKVTKPEDVKQAARLLPAERLRRHEAAVRPRRAARSRRCGRSATECDKSDPEHVHLQRPAQAARQLRDDPRRSTTSRAKRSSPATPAFLPPLKKANADGRADAARPGALARRRRSTR